ncbi:MAG: phosphatase PAP2 family protein [Candidatus Phytoplasma stylosanthis]|nr:phosphatase PAP2 family protein [Candidatus Phytoplasma stylosanthis]
MINTKENEKYSKKEYIKKFLFLVFIQQASYHFVLFFIYKNERMIPRYISENLISEKNNWWINILNLGLNNKFGETLGFPDIKYFENFVFIYLISILWWYFLTPFFVYKYLDKKTIKSLYKSTFIVLFFSLLIFIIFPIEALKIFQFKTFKYGSISGKLLEKIYEIDYTRLNSLPSLHVAISFLCYIPFRLKNNNVPKKVFWFQFIMAFLVFISTFAIKQHYIADGIISIILVELVYFLISRKENNKKIVK